MASIGISREKLRRLVSEQCSASLMSDTKWRRCLPLIREYQTGLTGRTRVKLITDSEVSSWGYFILPAEGYIEFFPEVGPVLFLEMEWLEIDVSAIGPALLGQLQTDGLPVTVDAGIARIWGHVRHGQQIPFIPRETDVSS